VPFLEVSFVKYKRPGVYDIENRTAEGYCLVAATDRQHQREVGVMDLDGSPKKKAIYEVHLYAY
jgi:hypothetical protein